MSTVQHIFAPRSLRATWMALWMIDLYSMINQKRSKIKKMSGKTEIKKMERETSMSQWML